MRSVVSRSRKGLVQGLTIGIVEGVPGVNRRQVDDGALGKVRRLVEHEPPIPHAGPKG